MQHASLALPTCASGVSQPALQRLQADKRMRRACRRHHLYPDLPRHQLRRASAYVRPMCRELGIEYHSPPFFQACPVSRV